MTLSVALGGRRGGTLTTSGSFVMSSGGGGNRAGRGEELGDDNDELGLDDSPTFGKTALAKQDWDLTNSGQCAEGTEAWVQTDARDTSMGKCVQFEADTKCSPQCFHQGKSVDETEERAVCTKICRVPGANGANCNVIKMVMPQHDESDEKTWYLTKSKVMQAGLTKDNLGEADPMACAGVATNRQPKPMEATDKIKDIEE
jgi:hypothetical protein